MKEQIQTYMSRLQLSLPNFLQVVSAEHTALASSRAYGVSEYETPNFGTVKPHRRIIALTRLCVPNPSEDRLSNGFPATLDSTHFFEEMRGWMMYQVKRRPNREGLSGDQRATASALRKDKISLSRLDPESEEAKAITARLESLSPVTRLGTEPEIEPLEDLMPPSMLDLIAQNAAGRHSTMPNARGPRNNNDSIDQEWADHICAHVMLYREMVGIGTDHESDVFLGRPPTDKDSLAYTYYRFIMEALQGELDKPLSQEFLERFTAETDDQFEKRNPHNSSLIQSRVPTEESRRDNSSFTLGRPSFSYGVPGLPQLEASKQRFDKFTGKLVAPTSGSSEIGI